MEHAFAKVCEVFGIESLTKHQEDAIKYVVEEKKDVFVNLPTGFRKSLIYQALLLVYSCLQSTVEKKYNRRDFSTDKSDERSSYAPYFPWYHRHISSRNNHRKAV